MHLLPVQFNSSVTDVLLRVTSRRILECTFVAIVLLIWQLAASSPILTAQDRRDLEWPTWKNGTTRIGSTEAEVHPSVKPAWVYAAAAAPRMSWSSVEGRVIENHLIANRTQYDDAIHPIVANGRVFFGSSVDDHLHCMDLETGRQLWSFAAGAAIRLAPTAQGDRVYFGSDDGHAYCLSASDGQLVWKLRAGPADDWLLARGEMISRWPVRTSVLIDKGQAFFGAGIFPHDDVFVYCVNAADGSIVWRQDHISEQDAGRNGLSPQGYFLITDDLLFVPSGGSLPAVLDRTTGEFLHKRTLSWRTTAGGVVGGFAALLSDGQLYTSGAHHWLAMEQKSGEAGFGWFAGRQFIVQGDQAFAATGEVVAKYDRMKYAVNSRRRHELEMLVRDLNSKLPNAGDQAGDMLKQIADAQAEITKIADIGIQWKQSTQDDGAILATRDMVFHGGQNRVTGYSSATGERLWRVEIEGEATGIVAVKNHLLVSTSTGRIYDFQDSAIPKSESPTTGNQWVRDPFPVDEWTPIYARAAEEILQLSNIRRGFCLVIGSDEGRLALELASRSDLQIYAVESDAEKVRAARAALAKTGLYGERIVVHQVANDDLPYSNYFANLIVSDTQIRTGRLPANPAAYARLLKPVGGTLALHLTSNPSGIAPTATQLSEWLESVGLGSEATVRTRGQWNWLERGPLPGAGNWSHQYGNPANTAISSDTRVKGSMGVLWYGDPGPGDMVNRHEGAVGPLATNGRLFVQGETTILAYDAYNGLFLWKHENPNALRTGVFQNQNPANLAATNDRLYHFVKDECLELDAATGIVLRTLRLPSAQDDDRHEWGYLATDGKLLFGAATVRKELEQRQRRRGKVTEDATDCLFAIDLATGKHLWTFQGNVISHHTIAIGPDRVFFIDSSITSEKRAEILREDKSQLELLTGKEREIAEQRALNADIRRAVALEASTGKVLWSNPVDVTDCSDIGAGGGKLSLMYHNDTLLLGGANANGHYWKQFVAGDFSRRRLVALSASQGYKRWAKDANYKGRPIIIGEKVLAEPWAFELQSGEQITRENPVTGKPVAWSLMRTGHHCGIITGCDSGMLMFRSGDTAFYDLETDAGASHFAGHRLGCWVNAIPANGLIMIPEASAGCVCQFSIASTIVMEPREPRRQWRIHSAVGGLTPVKSMHINLGAPGDRKDERGNLWLSYPRRAAYQETKLDIKLDLHPVFSSTGRFSSVSESSEQVVAGKDAAWLYTSWAEGLEQITLPLLGPEDPPATYRLRLHFARIEQDRDQPVVFDVVHSGAVVFQDVTLEPVADSQLKPLIKEIADVAVKDNLVLEFKAKHGTPRLHAIEVNRMDAK